MSFTPAELTKSWENPADFPTYEESEDQVRADMQILFTELKNCINTLIDELEAANTQGAGSGASSIGIDQIAELGDYTNVQDALVALTAAIAGIVLEQVPDYSITHDKLSSSSQASGPAVWGNNIADDTIYGGKIHNGAITDVKCDFSGGLHVGALVSNGAIFLSGDSYGTNLPASASAGRLFFKKVQ